MISDGTVHTTLRRARRQQRLASVVYKLGAALSGLTSAAGFVAAFADAGSALAIILVGVGCCGLGFAVCANYWASGHLDSVAEQLAGHVERHGDLQQLPTATLIDIVTSTSQPQRWWCDHVFDELSRRCGHWDPIAGLHIYGALRHVADGSDHQKTLARIHQTVVDHTGNVQQLLGLCTRAPHTVEHWDGLARIARHGDDATRLAAAVADRWYDGHAGGVDYAQLAERIDQLAGLRPDALELAARLGDAGISDYRELRDLTARMLNEPARGDIDDAVAV